MVEPDVNKEYERYAHIVNADEQYMPSWCMYFCSLSDSKLRYEGEVDVMNSQSDELSEDNNIEYYRNMEKHGKEFDKELVNASDVLQSCNYPVSRPQDTVSQTSTKDQNQEMIVDDGISVPSKNLYSSTATNKVLVKKIYNNDEQELRCFSKKQQVFKEHRCLGFQSSIPTSDCCDISSGRDRNKEDCDSTGNRSKETTNQCTDECTCVAIQETSTGYYDGCQDHSSEDHSNNTPLHLGEDYHPKKIEYFAAPTGYWYFSALDYYFHLEEDETDYELQTNDYPEFVVVSSLVRAESVQTPKQCFINGQTSSCVVRRLTYSHRCVSFINLLLLSSTTLSCVSGSVGFDEVPVTQEVATGAQAVFRCRHPTASTIRWRVNGSLLGRSPPPDITPDTTRDDNGNLVDILTIIARPEYNGTEVVCVARFDDERPEEQSQPAILTVLMNASAVDDVFLISPASLNVTVDTVAEFQCQRPTAHGINWKINGSILQGLSEGFSAGRNEDGVFSLNIKALTEYNQTMIQCVAFFIDSPSEESEESLMMIQGILQPVTNLSRIDSTISWSPPLSLDLTNIDPDIVYCVEVYNITCGERDLITSDCLVTEPSYTFYDLLDGYIYEYIVTPRSNVSGARNGTPSQPFRDLFVKFSVNSSHLTANGSSTMYMYEAELNSMKFKGPIAMPSTCMLILESLDGLGDYEKTITCNRDNIPINLEVHPRRLWKCMVLAYGCWNHSILVEDPELSTHDVQNISVSSTRVGSIAVTGDFIQGSTAIGVLIITINSLNSTQYHLCHRNGNNAQIEDTISGLAGGHHRVSAFALEKGGHPFNRTAATPKSVFVMNGSELAPSSSIVYDLHSNSTHICVTCMFMSSTPTSCLVVVHQRISQLNSSGLMNIESSHIFTTSGDTACGCIEINLKEYQVGVVDGKFVVDLPQEGSSSVCIGCVAGSVVFIVFTLAVVIIALILYRKILKDRRQDVLEASIYVMDTSSRNQYEHIPSLTPTKAELSIGENMPLVSTHRVESDGHAEGNNEQSTFQTPPALSPPMIPQADAELTEEAVEATKIIYSEPDHHPNPGFSAPPLQGDEPQYSSVSNFKNPQGVVYACHVVKPLSTTTQPLIVDDSTKTLSQYSELIHPPDCQEKPATTLTRTLSNNGENPTSPIVRSSPTPCTVGNLLPLLRPIASKWLPLGEALSIDEDDLDIINTNNETDEACLQDMLEFYEEKSDFQHTWEVMATALKQINQEGLFEKIHSLYIEPYTNLIPGQTEVVCTEGSPTSTPPPLESVSIQRLYCHLLPLSSKWLSLGVALLIDKGQLNEISRNNETDKTCLLKMLELYMMRSGHNFSWEEIEAVEMKVREEAVDLNLGGCAQKESEKEHVEMEPHHNISPDYHTLYVHGVGLQGCSSSVLDNSAMLTSGTHDTQLFMGDNTTNPLTSTLVNKTDAGKASFSSSRIPPPELNNNSGSIQPEAHDTGLEKIYVNGTTIDNRDTNLEPSSQGKTYNVIEDHVTCTTEVSDDVAITDLSHGNTHESCAKKPIDIKKAPESGYVTFDADNSTMDVEEYSSVNIDHSEQRKVYCQCGDAPISATHYSHSMVDESKNPVIAPTEKRHHHMTFDENQDPTERNSFPRRDIPVHTSQSVFKIFVYEQDNYFEGTEIHKSDDTQNREACLSPETVLNKRLRVDKRNKLRANFHRFQEIAR